MLHLLLYLPVQSISPYFAFTHLIKAWNKWAGPRNVQRQYSLKTPSRLRNELSGWKVNSLPQRGRHPSPQPMSWISFGQMTSNHNVVLFWNEMSHQIIGGFTILANWLNSLKALEDAKWRSRLVFYWSCFQRRKHLPAVERWALLCQATPQYPRKMVPFLRHNEGGTQEEVKTQKLKNWVL